MIYTLSLSNSAGAPVYWAEISYEITEPLLCHLVTVSTWSHLLVLACHTKSCVVEEERIKFETPADHLGKVKPAMRSSTGRIYNRQKDWLRVNWKIEIEVGTQHEKKSSTLAWAIGFPVDTFLKTKLLCSYSVRTDFLLICDDDDDWVSEWLIDWLNKRLKPLWKQVGTILIGSLLFCQCANPTSCLLPVQSLVVTLIY